MSENYIVSARKYRPDSFSAIVGQEATAQTLKSAVQSARLAHAYLFCGPRGVGKTTAARVLAKTINCMNLGEDGEACNRCESCKAFNEQRSFNIFELDAASNNSVDDIRGLTDQVSMPPALGKYKVYIIDEVHMLSQAAFNAFLKTLEEPPSYAIFILATTERHKILPTILSRCQIYDFRRITTLDIVHHLSYVAHEEGISTEEEALALIAEKADGGMRDALSMFDRIASYSNKQITYAAARSSLNVLDHTEYIQFVEALLSGNYRGLLLLLDDLLRRGFDGQVIVTGLASFMRDLLVSQHPETLALLEKPASVATQYQAIGERCHRQILYQGIKQLVSCDQQYKAATNKRLLVELTLLNLLSIFRSSPQHSNTNSQEPTRDNAQTSQSELGAASQPEQPPTPSAAEEATQIAHISEVPKQQATEPTEEPRAVEPPPAEKQPTIVRITSPQREEAHLGRQRYRSLRARGQMVAPATTTFSEEIIDEHEPYTELDVQRGWQAYIETQLNPEKVICHNIMQQEFPRLLPDGHIEVAVTNTSSIIEAMEEERPRVEFFIRKLLHNGGIKLTVRPKSSDEEVFVPTTSEERYTHLVTHNQALQTLRKDLQLRLL